MSRRVLPAPVYMRKQHKTSPATTSRLGGGYKVNDTFVTGVEGNLGFRKVTSLSTLVVETFDFESSGNHFWNTTAFHNSTLPILDFYIAYTPGGPEAALRNQTPVLLECLLTCK